MQFAFRLTHPIPTNASMAALEDGLNFLTARGWKYDGFSYPHPTKPVTIELPEACRRDDRG